MATSTSLCSSSSSGIINIRDTPAVVEWTSPPPAVDGQLPTNAATVCHLALSSKSSSITFTMFFDPSSNAAFFKLRATVFVRDSSRNKVPTFVYLFLHPENVVSLVHEPSSRLPQEVAAASKKLSGCHTTCLRFTLKKPASFIAPLHLPLSPVFENDNQVLDCWKTLANQNNLAVHLPHQASSTFALVALACDAAARKTLKSSYNHGDLSQHYGGQGGKVIADLQDWPVPFARSDEQTAALKTSAKEPPSYDELGPSPSRAPHSALSSKRRRTSSESTEDKVDAQSVLARCKRAMNEHMTQMRNEIRSELRDEIHNELRSDILDEMRVEVKAQFKKLEEGFMERIDGRFDDQLSQLREEVLLEVASAVEQIEGVEEHVDSLIEDKVLGVKIDMEDFVKDEMADVEKTIVGHLEDGRISLQFDR